MSVRPRSWWLAGLLSLILPGLGQVYNGDWEKGMALLAVSIPTRIYLVLLLYTPFFHLIVPLALLFSIALFGYAVGDAILTSRGRGQAYVLRPFNRVWVYAGIVLVALIARETLDLILKENFLQAFRVPSESMRPTLLVGDYFFVDKRPIAREASRGDVILFAFPEDPRRQHVMRVVAVGGDEIEIRDKVVRVNGRPRQEGPVLHIDPTVHPASFDPRDNFGPYAVPRNAYFVLGDNRDNSNDSRFRGPVRASNVLGRARGIYWSIDRGGVRWDRIGMNIR